MRHLRNVAVTVVVALAAWVSLGALAVSGPGADTPRVGVLPPTWVLLASSFAALLLVMILRRRGLSVAPLLLSGIALLPWLPVTVPEAFLIWTGPLAVVPWIAAFGGLTATAGGLRRLAPAALVARARDPGRAPWLAAGVAAMVFGLASWRAAPMFPGGDEPHYLIITQSLLHDVDLRIEDNHQRREFQAYVNLPDLKPDYLVRGQDGEIYSIHAPGLSVLVLPAFAVAGYTGVKIFLALLSALGSALAWRLAWRVTGDVTAAWVGWGAVFGSTSWVFHSFSVYPDAPGGLAMLVAVWLVLRLGSRDPAPGVAALALTGGALAALPWLHSRFALLAGPLGLLVLVALARRHPGKAGVRPAAWFLGLPVVGALAWFGFFYAIYGTLDPLAPYGTLIEAGSRLDQIPDGLTGLLFDQQFGLLTHAPVLAAVFFGLGSLLGRRGHRLLAVAVLAPAVVYLLSVTNYRMWWGGWSAPARFMCPLLPALAIPAAVAWARCRSRASRSLYLAATVVTLATTTSLVWVERGRLAFDVRDGHSLWFQWLSPLADLTLGLPSFFRTTEARSFGHVAIWIVSLAVAWLVLRVVERREPGVVTWAMAVPSVLVVTAMTATGVVWRSNDESGLTPTAAQLALLRAAAANPGPGVWFTPARVIAADGRARVVRRIGLDAIPQAPRFIAAGSAAGQLAIAAPFRHLQTRDRPLLVLPRIPAGKYRLHFEAFPNPTGEVQLGIAAEPLVLRRIRLAPVAPLGSGSVEVTFPVEVRAVVIRADEDARSAVHRVTLEPVRVTGPSRSVAAGTSRRAVGYAGGEVYFLDEGAFAEPDAFWVRGAGSALVALQPHPSMQAGAARSAIDVFVRNAPVDNRLIIEAGRWREEVVLGPGEERTVHIPVAPGAASAAVRFTAATGFRPSERVAGSRDQRFLGVWITLPE